MKLFWKVMRNLAKTAAKLVSVACVAIVIAVVSEHLFGDSLYGILLLCCLAFAGICLEEVEKARAEIEKELP